MEVADTEPIGIEIGITSSNLALEQRLLGHLEAKIPGQDKAITQPKAQ